MMKMIEEIEHEDDSNADEESIATEETNNRDEKKFSSDNPNIEDDDSFVIKQKESSETSDEYTLEDLMKKTNDELKKILKDQNKNLKGTKQELVKRVLE